MAEPKEYLVKHIVVEAYQVESDVEVEVSIDHVIARQGDWIVTHKNGKRKIVKADEFAKNYMPMRG